MFSCGSHNGFISTINAVLSFQLLFLCFHFYSTVLSLGHAFLEGGTLAVAAPPRRGRRRFAAQRRVRDQRASNAARLISCGAGWKPPRPRTPS